MYRYDQKLFDDIVAMLVEFGFEVWRATGYRRTHGFYTDETGERVVSFQTTGGQIRFSGNYHASRNCGSGWCIEEYAPRNKTMAHDWLYMPAPNWANPSPLYTTKVEHLRTYQKSSKYERVTI